MTDLMDLLDSAAGRPAAPTSQTVDGDLRRGRRALLHRRWARGGALVVTGAAVAVGIAVLPGAAPSSGQHRVVPAAGGVTATGPTSSPPANGQSGATSVPTPGPGTLVPADPSGKDHAFSAALVPHAWQQQLSDYVLAFEPPGTDTVINDFGGKLVVMLAGGVTPPSDARHLQIGGNEARAWAEGDTSTYYVALADGGTNLVLQVPAALGWDDTTVARFAEGLAVGPGARAGVG